MLKFFNIWVVFTLAIFYFGPIPWPLRNDYSIGAYVLLCLMFFNAAYVFTPMRLGQRAQLPELTLSSRAEYIVIAAYLVLVAITIFITSDKWIFDPSAYTLNFGDVYTEYLKSSADADARNSVPAYIAILGKMALFPLVIYVFLKNSGKNWFKVGMIAAIFLMSSAIRGTDKEVFDIIILIFVAMLYKRMLGRVAIVSILLGPVALLLFTIRRVDRYGGALPPCLPDGISCFNFQSPLAKIHESIEILYVFFSSYISQGYNALGMTFDMDAGWNYGLGHMPTLQSVTCSLANLNCNPNNYQYHLDMVGWDPSAQWTTVYPILANDFTYYGVPLYFALFGFLFRFMESQWRTFQNIPALCGLLLITQFMVFSCANMQIAVSLDWSMATLIFLYFPAIWLLRLQK